MPGYREIVIAGEGRHPRTQAAPGRRVPAGDWRAVLRGAAADTAGLCRRSPGTVVAGAASLAAAGLICFNALGHQSGRHPAPILPKVAAAAPTPTIVAPKSAAPKPLAQAEPAKDAPKPEAKAPSPRPPARDAIGELIRSEETTASVSPRTEPKPKEAKPKPDTPVVQAQRALSRLGYGTIKPDGLMGPGTKAAIEAFERKAKLPVTGEAAGQTLRALLSKAKQV